MADVGRTGDRHGCGWRRDRQAVNFWTADRNRGRTNTRVTSRQIRRTGAEHQHPLTAACRAAGPSSDDPNPMRHACIRPALAENPKVAVSVCCIMATGFSVQCFAGQTRGFVGRRPSVGKQVFGARSLELSRAAIAGADHRPEVSVGSGQRTNWRLVTRVLVLPQIGWQCESPALGDLQRLRFSPPIRYIPTMRP